MVPFVFLFNPDKSGLLLLLTPKEEAKKGGFNKVRVKILLVLVC